VKPGKIIIFHKTTYDAGKEQFTKHNLAKIQIIEKLYWITAFAKARAKVRTRLVNQVIMHEFL